MMGDWSCDDGPTRWDAMREEAEETPERKCGTCGAYDPCPCCGCCGMCIDSLEWTYPGDILECWRP